MYFQGLFFNERVIVGSGDTIMLEVFIFKTIPSLYRLIVSITVYTVTNNLQCLIRSTVLWIFSSASNMHCPFTNGTNRRPAK